MPVKQADIAGMVGSWGLEPQTSTVSQQPDYVLPTK
jgi:hypothetical protein